MVRLSDLHEVEASHMRARAATMHPVAPAPWITPKPLRESTIAIVSTAGLHRREDVPFKAGAVDYRLLPGDVDFADVVVSHISTNFDRSAFQQDPNIWFPLDRLREMAADGESEFALWTEVLDFYGMFTLPTELLWETIFGEIIETEDTADGCGGSIARSVYRSAVLDESISHCAPLLAREQLHQIAFHLHRVFVLCQPKSLG